MPNYDLIIYWCDIAILIAYGILFLFLFYYILFIFLAFKKPRKFKKGETMYKYLVIIPARNESKVIKNILKSLKVQTYDKKNFDVYVITESKDDPTNSIAKKMGYNYYVRQDLVHKNTKGFAIKEFIAYLKKNKLDEKYDSYIIFDADNLMDKNYIESLNNMKNAGYQVGFGYRNFTNANKNWVTGCSAILFTLLNQVFSKGRSILFKKVMISGTGYFIDKKIIDDIGEWIFTGMTEDVQVSTYCEYHNIAMAYDETIQYYDEEPISMTVMHKQHVRWIWGFLANRKEFRKKEPNYHANKEYVAGLARFEFNLALYPIVIYIVFIFLAYLTEIALFLSSFYFNPSISGWLFLHTLIPFSSLYFLFFLLAIFIIAIDQKHLKFSFGLILASIFSFTFYFLDFIICFFEGLFNKKKRSTWVPIEHKGAIISNDAKKAEK
jgi:1,2-diacylglycerol 3-beta-glucosyltransferase